MKKFLVLAAVATAALVFASAAFPSALTCSHGATCQSGGTQTDGTGTLPFTGLNLAGIAVIGGLLLVSGLTLHRVSRRRQ